MAQNVDIFSTGYVQVAYLVWNLAQIAVVTFNLFYIESNFLAVKFSFRFLDSGFRVVNKVRPVSCWLMGPLYSQGNISHTKGYLQWSRNLSNLDIRSVAAAFEFCSNCSPAAVKENLKAVMLELVGHLPCFS